ncbi:pyridoxamine 5'-phosphate oxidase family protein [Pseudoxanthomonas mexicana]|uniref:pyridoxamine 5'-phosphate oxidase family protein n=1 Tax=Pseudoxanthomonas mexicana TaxID=128785 RepID=UPI00398AA991
MTEHQENIRKLADLIKGIDIAMLTTTSADGRLVSRPLATQEVEFDGDLWFATSADSHKVAEIRANPRVNVAYASRDRNDYVSVSGLAQVVDDRARTAQLWTPAMKAFFPGGPDDPDLRLIRVAVESAEYWDGPGTVFGKALHFLMSAASENPRVLAENETLQIR